MKKRLILYSSVIFIVIILIWGFSDLWINYLFGSRGNDISFNDTFNSISALFSALAFAGLIITILIQRQDINKQTSINNIQNFENNFFRLLEQHHKIIDSFVIEIKPNKKNDTIEPYPFDKKVVSQLDAFDYLAKDFKHRYEEVKKIRFPSDKSHKTVFVHAYLHHIFRKYGFMLGHYFRNLYHVIKYIDESKSLKTWDEKYKYVRILRAQLSAPEINLIAWNGLSMYGKGFKPLIENYRLLKNMNFSYQMVDLLWLSEEYPHIRKSVWRINSIFYKGSKFESEIEKFEKEEKGKN